MTFDQLQLVQAIVETGSFRAAGERLNRAQSAVSYGIRQLEELLGFALFDRSSYRPKLTEQGSVFYAKSLGVLGELRNLELLGEELGKGVEAQLSIAISTIFPVDIVMQAVKDFVTQFPTTRLKLLVEHMNVPEAMVHEGRCDLAVADQFEEFADVYAEVVAEVELIPVASAKHPLALKGEDLNRSQVASYTQVVVSGKPSEFREYSRGVVPGAHLWHVTDFHMKKEILLHGLGWGSMPKHLVMGELGDKSLVALRFQENQSRKMCLIRRRDRSAGVALTCLWKLLKERCRG